MFGLKFDTVDWFAVIGVAYLALRVAYGVGRVIWWYANDTLRKLALNSYLPFHTGLAIAAMSVCLVWHALDLQPGRLSTTALSTVVGIVGFFIGAAFDFVLDFRLHRISNWLMSLRMSQYRDRLLNGEVEMRLAAAERLATLGAYADPARPELFTAFKDESADVRAAAARAIWLSAPDPPPEDDIETPKSARALLIDPDVRVRVYAAAILIPFKAATPAEVLPALCEALSLADDNILVAATHVLEQMGPAAEPAVASLRAAVLVRTKPYLMAIDTLGKIGAPAVPVLIEILRHGDVSCKRQAANTLGTMSEAAREALPALRKVAASPNSVLSSAAQQAIAKLGGEAAER
jgi:hypothetical protein